ncbi:hypothetical protein IGI37_003843 [Enterococcus sp. AZ194]|uniref:hypothetical protein n=1 Tax=Enterococcus sp. AZ194 TaxID=2774629 RepID=UPI003F2999E9
MRNNNPLFAILTIVALFIGGGIILSAVLGLLSGLFWLAIRIFIPVAIAVWIVRVITGRGRSRRYY